MINPIPRHLLIHEIEYEEFIRDGSFGEEFKDPETIVHVLVQPKTVLSRGSNNEEVQVRSIMFIDLMNTPNAKELIVKSKVRFNGKVMRVNACNAYYTLDPVTPHHYEVELI